MQPRYEDDFYSWANSTAILLKEGRFEEADMEHIVEELENMSGRECSALVSNLSQLICHLLKWQYQPGYRGSSWGNSIQEHRDRLNDLFDYSPSLSARRNDFLPKAYKYGKRNAIKQTGLPGSTFPDECPYTFEQCLDDEFYPEDRGLEAC